MKAKVLRTEEEYAQALAQIEELMDAEPGSPEEEELELFSVLVERFEDEHYPISLPDPVEAIKFRMEQEGLTRKDMRKYLGSQSKVSEILNRKRTLSLSMIRSLHEGLGIPAEVLLQEPGQTLEAQQHDFRDFPFNEMFNRGYFPHFEGTLYQAKEQAEELLQDLFTILPEGEQQPIYCRRTDREVDEYALVAWKAKVIQQINQEEIPDFTWEYMSIDFLQELVKLSYLDQGPLLAKEMLHKQGIHLIIEKHLPQTYLDGAAFLSPTGEPIVGLTLRYDREDYYWFTLLHELAHLYLHLRSDPTAAFFDETHRYGDGAKNPQEEEADQLTKDLLIPPQVWEEESNTLLESTRKRNLVEFANRLRISPAVVAGRVRWETGDYSRFSSLVGNKNIREQFPEYSQ